MANVDGGPLARMVLETNDVLLDLELSAFDLIDGLMADRWPDALAAVRWGWAQRPGDPQAVRRFRERWRSVYLQTGGEVIVYGNRLWEEAADVTVESLRREFRWVADQLGLESGPEAGAAAAEEARDGLIDAAVGMFAAQVSAFGVDLTSLSGDDQDAVEGEARRLWFAPVGGWKATARAGFMGLANALRLTGMQAFNDA